MRIVVALCGLLLVKPRAAVTGGCLQSTGLGPLEDGVQCLSAGRPHPWGPLGRHLALEDLVYRDGLAVEGSVCFFALGNDRAIDPDSGIEAS